MLQFKHFNNPIYCATQLTNFTCVLLKIYILWREYKFNEDTQYRPPEVRHMMSGQRFLFLKKRHKKLLYFELIQESWVFLVHIVFVDELSFRSLWDISTKLSPSAEEMSITQMFILANTCKDFLIFLPLNYYQYTRKYGLSIFLALQLLFQEFVSTQVVQFIILNCWTYSSFMIANVSQTVLIVTITVSLSTFIFGRDFLLVNILVDRKVKPFKDETILTKLRPFLKRMNFPEENIHLYKAKPMESPNAFTVGHGLFENEKIVVANNMIGEKPHLNQCCSHEEVSSIILHELGHVYHHHILKLCLLELAITMSTSVFFVLLHQPRVFAAFGFPGEIPVLISLHIRMEVLLSFNVLCAFLFMQHLRHAELQADLFSFTFSGYHYRQALLKISLFRPHDIQVHDSLYSAWNFSHPSLIERLNNLYK